MNNNIIRINYDGVEFKLKEFQDFSWLKNWGTIFCVFDQQDSGNICFGVQGENKKYFIKYAGAKTINYNGDADTAIKQLKASNEIYDNLKCEYLIQLEASFNTKYGYVTVYNWEEGENLHAYWTFDKYPKYTHPNSAYYRYKHLTLENKLKSIDTIFKFICHVEREGYVAIDFYDGSIIYDFETNTTKICDIDFFRKRPTINDIGKEFWGSDRFKSPEEYILGSPIDERTNVFNLGALIFGILGDDKHRTYEKWTATKLLYNMATKATQENREKRFESVTEFYKQWKRCIQIEDK